MMIVMHAHASEGEVQTVLEAIRRHGFQPHISQGEERVVIGVVGEARRAEPDAFLRLPGVARVVPLSRPYKLASREFHPADRTVHVGGVRIGGGGEPVFIAGPCSVESRAQLLETAHAVKEAGAQMLRGDGQMPQGCLHGRREAAAGKGRWKRFSACSSKGVSGSTTSGTGRGS
jgi:3-deoxy-7-phosphoheptulonate synthase